MQIALVLASISLSQIPALSYYYIPLPYIKIYLKILTATCLSIDSSQITVDNPQTSPWFFFLNQKNSPY